VLSGTVTEALQRGINISKPVLIAKLHFAQFGQRIYYDGIAAGWSTLD
jgi:hypothetical protein